MSERWRDTYDAWKLASPEDDGVPQCENCGEPMTRWPRRGWHCEECSPRDPDAELDALRDREMDREP